MRSPQAAYSPSPKESSHRRNGDRRQIFVQDSGIAANRALLSEFDASGTQARDFTSRLIAAQEDERRRIARELHDDLSQRMALLMIGLDQVKASVAEIGAKQRLTSLAKVADDIATSLHTISHQLHPSKLESLGLVAALASYCRDMSARHNLQIQFQRRGVRQHIPMDISVCLYRILQEALRNVVKHSGAQRVTVRLLECFGGIELTVSDAGTGFEVTPDKIARGLGLTSMRERLCLVRGELTIESSSRGGTRIGAWAPLGKEETVKRAVRERV